MRKALTLSAAAVAAAVTLGAPASAFAADAPPVPVKPVSQPVQPLTAPAKDVTPPMQPIASPTPAPVLGVTLDPSTAKPGDKVDAVITIKGQLSDAKLSSPVLTDTQVKDGRGSGKVKADAKPGRYPVTVSGTADGKQVSANAFLTVVPAAAPVKPATPPAPVKPAPGDKPEASVTPPEKHIVPKGSVDTGMAPVAASSGTADLTAAGIAAAGAAALLGLTLASRRRSRSDS
ncbi:hypothetical protein [Streptomyces sp. NPDC001594]|uniref:hypothetical protein n=1 Tax=Streptomyces sp. NPDC001594 TaxID=3364590 RepID=UPI0036C353A2